MKLKVLSFLLILVFASYDVVHAAKLDIHTHDLVIEKLESVLEGIRGQKSEASVHVRLADLYADRARLKSMQEVEQGCDNCLQAKADREQAIKSYAKAIQISKGKQDPRWALQMAHLYNLNGQPEKSEAILLAIVKNKKNYTADLIGESYAALGEFNYKMGKFNQAKKYFETALTYKISNPYIVKYRLAWCYFNEGRLASAQSLIYTILQDKNFKDESLRKDFSRDLVTFVAREVVDESSVNKLMNVTPEDQKKNNMFYLGQECDRLGNKKGSLLVWALYAKMNDVNNDEHLEMTIRTAQTLLDQNKLDESLVSYQRFFTLFKDKRCESKDVCGEVQAKSRQYVYNWIKKEKSAPKPQLVKALEIYGANNPDDVEMLNWSGHIAKHLKNNKQAAQNYHFAAEQSYRLIKKDNFENSSLTKEQVIKIFEGALLAEIECAEESQNSTQMNMAYDHYISLNPSGDKIDEVKYQKAYLSYTNKEFKVAAASFYALATENNKLSRELKIKSADLSLECYENLKDFSQLTEKSQKYAQVLPEKANAYQDIARKSIVNQAVANAKTNPKAAYALIATAPLAGATADDRVKIYKNKIAMAEKLLDINGVEDAATQLLLIKGLSSADKQFANEKLLWVAESKLDFNKALYLVKRNSFAEMKESDRILKIAVLTELSGQYAGREYEKYLRHTKDVTKSNVIRAKLVRESVNPWYTLSVYKKELRRTPEIYAATLIDAYARSKNMNEAKKYLSERVLRNQPALRAFKRLDQLAQLQKMDREIAQHRINTKNDTQLKRTLEQRLKLITKWNDATKKAARQGDFSQQVIASNVLERENRRLAREIQNFPAPKNLKKAQRAEYAKLLKSQAQPIEQRANHVEKQNEQLWSKSTYLDQIYKLLEVQTRQQNEIIFDELNIISKYAKSNIANKIRAEIADARQKIDRRDILAARDAVKNDPFNESKISRLRDLEQKNGATTMVAFLDARLVSVQKGRL